MSTDLDQATRTEIEEALSTANATAKRTLAFDNLGRTNPHWAKQHAYLDHLLDLWQESPEVTPE